MRPSLTTDVLATLALASFSLAVAAGYARVFAGWGFFDNMALLVLGGHAAGLAFRRLGVPGWIAVPAMAALLAWAIGALHYRFTYSNLLPTTETWDLFRDELELVRGQFRTAVAPVIYGAGWDVLAAIGLAMAVLLSDTFAFRAQARAEALVPGGVLFVFVSALGADRLRVPLTVLLVATGALTVIVLRAYHSGAPVLMSRGRSAIRRLVGPVGIATAVVVGLAAGFVGPRLPGASAEPVYDTRTGGAGSLTQVVSPLVDIRSRLTNQSPTELFVVQANQASYWRSSALAQFDGTRWELPEREIASADGQLAEARDRSVEIRQRVRVVNLGGRLVPAAADPLRVEGGDDLRWNGESATLVATGDELQAGDQFEILSAAPRFDPADLNVATVDNPPDPIYLEVPDDFPDVVRQTTLEVTAGASTPYAAALQLQNWLREFEYSLEVQSGHGTNAIEAFLRERKGYCEQFAGSFAAMLRTIGIPTRVAVGFTPGTNIGGDSFSVQGKNAHAWPEVWFDQFGWVPFEPTPGRGAPGAQNYTGVAAQQDDTVVEAPTDGEAAETAPTTVPGPGDVFSEEVPVPIGTEGDLPTSAAPTDDGPRVPWGWLFAVGVILVVVATPALVRRLRRRSPAAPAKELGRLWSRSTAALAQLGVVPDRSATPVEIAAVASDRFPVVARPIQSLADTLTATIYSEAGARDLDVTGRYGRTTLRSCANWTRQIERATNDSLSPMRRVRRYFTVWE